MYFIYSVHYLIFPQCSYHIWDGTHYKWNGNDGGGNYILNIKSLKIKNKICLQNIGVIYSCKSIFNVFNFKGNLRLKWGKSIKIFRQKNTIYII